MKCTVTIKTATDLRQHSSVKLVQKKNGWKYQVKSNVGDNQCSPAKKPTWLTQINSHSFHAKR